MSRALPVRRALAATAALAVAAWGATALPAAADPGQGKGEGQSQGQGKNDDKNQDKNQDKTDQGPKPGKGPKGPKSDQGQGPKPGKGPKTDQGQGPKPGKGPKTDQGQGPKPGKGPQGPKGPKGPKNENGDPAGNNGTVKITPIGQDDGTPQNNPHVPCGFDIEWYGFDEGPDIVSTVSLVMHAPTTDVELTPGGPSEVFVGGDPASGAGTDTGFDGEATYYPTFVGEPHPQQGYHIKLTVHTPGSQGADTKHKVFWVEPCATEVVGEEETDENGPDDQTDTETDTEVLGEQETTSDTDRDDDTEVLGVQASAPNAPSAADAGTDVPNAVAAGDEGDGLSGALTSPMGLGLLLLGLGLAGAVFVAARRPARLDG